MNLGPTKKKETVRVSDTDLRRLLNDNEQLSQQVDSLQDRCNEYLEEVRALKAKIAELELTKATAVDYDMPDHIDMRPHHGIGRGIYFD